MYTQEMQDFLSKTIHDFDSERVLNLDEDETNNFVVFSESVIMLSEETNTLVSVDDVNDVYMFENPDEVLLSLQPGDIFTYNAESTEVLIAAVGTIENDGNTVTITGGEASFENVFEYAKIDTEYEATENDYSPEGLGEGVTYVENSDEEESVFDILNHNKNAYEGIGATTSGLNFELNWAGKTPDPLSVTLTGTIAVQFKFDFKYYVSLTYQYIEFGIEDNFELNIKATGTLETKPIELGSINCPILPGVNVGFTPSITFSVTAEISVNIKYMERTAFALQNTFGEGYEFTDNSVPAEATASCKVEGKITFSIKFAPNVNIIDESVAKISFPITVTIEVIASLEKGFSTSDLSKPDSRHICAACINGVVTGKIEFAIELGLLSGIKLPGNLDLNYKHSYLGLEYNIGNFYYSFDFDEFGFSLCPHLEYRNTIKVLYPDGTPMTSDKANIYVDGKNYQGKLDSNGCIIFYWVPGTTHTVMVHVDIYFAKTTIYAKDKARITCISLEYIPIGDDEILQLTTTTPAVATSSKETTTKTTTSTYYEIANGACGENLTWVLDSEGTLTISGKGDMDNWSYSQAPWFENTEVIKKIIINDGVTSIGNYAFYNCSSLTEVIIPNSVTILGDCAFSFCSSLTKIIIPDNVTSIGNSAFSYCSSLNRIIILNNVTSIGTYAFSGCSRLSEVIIPDCVTSIEKCAFYNCTELTQIELSNNLTNISDHVFYGCIFLTDIVIPDNITSIDEGAFWNCKSLSEIIIPDSVTSIGKYAFNGCEKLVDITIPRGVTTIGDGAFAYCDSLNAIYVSNANEYYTSISGVLFDKNMAKLIKYPEGKAGEIYTIPNSVAKIESSAFYNCDFLIEITIPYNVTSIGSYTFSNCRLLSLIKIENPDCEISDEILGYAQVVTIYGYIGSTAQAYAGKYGREFVALDGTLTASLLKTAKNSAEESALLTKSFTELLPNEVYNFYVMKSRTVESPFSEENLLYVTQAVSDENGKLIVSYIPKETFEIADIFVAGLTRMDISSASVTVPEIIYTGGEILVNPEVTLNG